MNLPDDPSYVDQLMALGSRSTPTTVIQWPDGHEDVVIGFNRHEMERLLR